MCLSLWNHFLVVVHRIARALMYFPFCHVRPLSVMCVCVFVHVFALGWRLFTNEVNLGWLRVHARVQFTTTSTTVTAAQAGSEVCASICTMCTTHTCNSAHNPHSFDTTEAVHTRAFSVFRTQIYVCWGFCNGTYIPIVAQFSVCVV